MKSKTRCLLCVVSLLLLANLAAAAPVRFLLEATTAANISLLSSKYQFTVAESWTEPGHATHVIVMSSVPSAAALSALRAEPGVLEVEADAVVSQPETAPQSRIKLTPLEVLNVAFLTNQTTSFYGSTVRQSYVGQKATSIVELSDAHSRFGPGGGLVAIIDTGVDPNHPALKNVLLPGFDFTRNLAGTASELADLTQSTVAILDQSTVAILDKKIFPAVLNQSTVAILDAETVLRLNPKSLPAAFGHGTMVAGLVHLVAPGARILPLKAFRADGSSTLTDIVKAIRYAADYGADVISMSFSLSTPSPELKAAIDYAVSKGAICVASAGNEGKEHRLYPAGFAGTIGVGSTNFSDKRSPFSNFGDGVKTAAPGEALITTYPGNNYAGVWGTSFSTGLVSGAVAMLRQQRSRMSYGDVLDSLDAGPRVNQDMGDARLDVLRALISAGSN